MPTNCRKIRHADPAAAEKHIAGVEKYNARRGIVCARGLRLCVFFCDQCQSYHIRHEPREEPRS